MGLTTRSLRVGNAFAGSALFALLCCSVFIGIGLPVGAQSTTQDANANITYVSGTCKQTPPSFSLEKYYNQKAMLANVSTMLAAPDISTSAWDLGKDGAYVGYKLVWCSGYYLSAIIDLAKQKGFSVTTTCALAGTLVWPTYQVLVLEGYGTFTQADADAASTFYQLGGGIYFAVDDCPGTADRLNVALRTLPAPMNKMQLLNSDGMTPFALVPGNPVGDNQFGHHQAFTGVVAMSAGNSLSIGYYDGVSQLGPFAPLCTVTMDRPAGQCNYNDGTVLHSHATVFYLDPPVQLSSMVEACNWGRMMIDTGSTRYAVSSPDLRTGANRLGANAIVWLLNIEKIMERNSTSGSAYAPKNCSANATTGGSSSGDTQVLGCSNGDALTLKSATMMCHVSFSGQDPPACLALVVTADQGTTCVVDTSSSTIGTYWIMVDGKNSSLQFTVTAAALVPRGTVTAVTGSCVKQSSTSVSGCKDGSSMTIDWTLPYPRQLTIGLGSSASICQQFTVGGTLVTCVFGGLSKLARGKYQTYINGVATGIPLTIQTDIVALNHALCSRSHTVSPQGSSAVSVSRTLTTTVTTTPTITPPPTPTPTTQESMTESPTSKRTRSRTASQSGTSTVTVTQTLSTTTSSTQSVSGSSSVSQTTTTTMTLTTTRSATDASTDSVTETGVLSATASIAITNSTTQGVTLTEHVEPTATRALSQTRALTVSTTLTETLGVTQSVPVSGTRRWPTTSKSLRVSGSRTWQCVNGTVLSALFAPYAAAALTMQVTDVEVRSGKNTTLSLPSVGGIDANDLHVPWFEPWDAVVSVRAVSTPNQLGFATHTGFSAKIHLTFPMGIGSKTGAVPVVVFIPPIADYTIFATEVVALEMMLEDFTIGTLCASGAKGTLLGMVQLTVTADENAFLASAQQVVTPIVAVMTAASPFAAPDLQALIMISMMPCSNSYQRRTFAMFRALSVFTLDDSYEGVLWGNLIANLGGFGLHFAVVVVAMVAKKITLAEATLFARFPSVCLQVLWQLTYASNAFASIQLLSDDTGTVGGGSRALAAGMLIVFCVGVPGAMMFYILRKVEAWYQIYEFHKWRRSDTGLRVRLLSTWLLPVGRWEPEDVRRRLGPMVTLQCRPEFYWPLLPVVSPLLVALFSLVRNQSERVCVWVYLVLAALHVVLLLIIVLCKPLRSMIEDWFAAAAYIITTLYLVCSAINLAYPPVSAIATLLGVVVVLQVALLAVRLIYHVCHIFIARRLVDVVPSRLLFEWNCGRSRVEEDDGAGKGGEMSAMNPAHMDLYAELGDLMNYVDMDDDKHRKDDQGGDDSHYVPVLLERRRDDGDGARDEPSAPSMLVGGGASKNATHDDDLFSAFGLQRD
jgi:hypothetical protein